MQFSLKRISHNSRLSQETNAFAADLYCDGVKVGIAENAGHGGPTDVHLIHAKPERAKEILDWVKKQPDEVVKYEGGEYTLKSDLEHIVDKLLEEYLNAKHSPEAQIKRSCKKNICLKLAGDKPGEFHVIKKPNGVYSLAIKNAIIKKYGDKIVEFYNETLGGEKPV